MGRLCTLLVCGIQTFMCVCNCVYVFIQVVVKDTKQVEEIRQRELDITKETIQVLRKKMRL